jgi:hypothetical protein
MKDQSVDRNEGGDAEEQISRNMKWVRRGSRLERKFCPHRPCRAQVKRGIQNCEERGKQQPAQLAVR